MTVPDTTALADLLRPALEQSGVELVEVQWRGGRSSMLRLVVDRAGGVNLDDCERASMTASAILDAYDPIDQSYSLEVSSPGAERPIRSEADWRAALGRRVHLRLRRGEAEQVMEGRLVEVGGETLELEVRAPKERARRLTVAAADVLEARIAVDI